MVELFSVFVGQGLAPAVVEFRLFVSAGDKPSPYGGYQNINEKRKNDCVIQL